MNVAVAAAAVADMPTLRAGKALDAEAFALLRRRMVLDHCKWDPQVQDVATIAPFPLILSRAAWRELASAAEAMTRETLALEQRLLIRPDLWPHLDLPRPLRRLMRDASSVTPAAARVMRFDFHPTREGWRVSEVNSDVPGGYAEASALPRLMAELGGESAVPMGDPAAVVVERLAQQSDGLPVGLLSAPGFMEDAQVVALLARRLREQGVATHLVQPAHLHFEDGQLILQTSWYSGLLSSIVRFYQAEWLARLGDSAEWQPLFVGGRTPVTNPGVTCLSESKRLPLLWDELGVPLPAWRQYLPETRDVRSVRWRQDDGWILKTAYCNTGDTVLLPGTHSYSTLLDVTLQPGRWIAQRRFETQVIETPTGVFRPCLGVYTVDGVACGVYGRLSRGQVIDYAAMDVAVLVEERGK